MNRETLKKFLHFPKLVQKRVLFLWVFYLLFQVGFLFAWILTSTLFLKIFGVANVPYLFLVEGVAIIMGSLLTKYYFLRTNTNTFIKTALMAILSLMAVSLFVSDLTFIIFGVVLCAKSLIYPQVQLGLFKKIESFFSPTIGRKAIPIIETAETVGLVFGSILALGILQLSTDLFALFYWWAVPLVAMFLLLKREHLFIKKIKHLPQPLKKFEFESEKSLFSAGRKSFMLPLLLMVTVQSMLFVSVEVSFLREIESHHEQIEPQTKFSFTSLQANLFDVTKIVKDLEQKVALTAEKTVAHELGIFALATGFIALFFKLFITAQVVRKFGVFGTIFSFFSFFLAGILAFVFGRASAEILKGIQHGTYSLFASPYHLSFYAYNQKIRERLRHLLHGIVWPMGAVLASCLFLIGTSVRIILPALIVSALFLSWKLKQTFSLFSFKNYEEADKIEEKLHILEVLESFKKSNVSKKLAKELLKKYQPYILRKKIVESLKALENASVVHEYLYILNDKSESNELKINILEALYEDKNLRKYCKDKAFTESKLFETWQNLFALSQNSHLKKLVVMNIFKHISNEKTVLFLREILTQGNENLLSIALRSCVQFSDPEIVNEILPLLDHKSSRIRSHVIMAIWKFSSDQKRLTGMLAKMLHSDIIEEQISGIYAIGELKLKSFVPDIEKKLKQKIDPLRIHTLIALLKLEQKNYIESFTSIVIGKDDSLAHMAFHMRKRMNKDLQEKIEESVYGQVSAKVDIVLKNNKNLTNIAPEKISYFKRLFEFSEQYESLLVLDKITV